MKDLRVLLRKLSTTSRVSKVTLRRIAEENLRYTSSLKVRQMAKPGFPITWTYTISYLTLPTNIIDRMVVEFIEHIEKNLLKEDEVLRSKLVCFHHKQILSQGSINRHKQEIDNFLVGCDLIQEILIVE